MTEYIERHRVPLGPQLTLLYHRTASAQDALRVSCRFRLGYTQAAPGQVYALMKAFQSQYPPAWRPRLTLTPDWSHLTFTASPEYRRSLDEQWQRLFELESVLAPLEPLRDGLLQEQRWFMESQHHLLEAAFDQLAFADSVYDRLPLGSEDDLRNLDQPDLLDVYQAYFAPAQVYLHMTDHQSLPEVLARLQPLLTRTQHEVAWPSALTLNAAGPRTRRLEVETEGGWLYLGFLLPGMDRKDWIYGPLLKHWLADVWSERSAMPDLQLMDLEWRPRQLASVLNLRLHTSRPEAFQQHKTDLLRWLAEARQKFLTPRRLRSAVQRAVEETRKSQRPFYFELDEMLCGWAHCRQEFQELQLKSFADAVEQNLNANRLLILEACSERVPQRTQPDYQRELPKLGYAPIQSSTVSVPQFYQDCQRLYLRENWAAWVIPDAQRPFLELGMYFAGGASLDAVPGLSALLMNALSRRFYQLLESQEGRGALHHTDSWQSEVMQDVCFFKWGVNWSELPDALRLLHELLKDLPLDAFAVQALKQKQQALLLAQSLHPQQRADEQFARSGFPNHAYADSTQGSYLGLRQIQAMHLSQRWASMRKTSRAQLMVLGSVPLLLNAEILAPILSPIQEAHNPLPTLPRLRTRRGLVRCESTQLNGYCLEGQVFDEALPLEEHVQLELAARWLQDGIRSYFGAPLRCQVQHLRLGWYFQLSGLYTQEQRRNWVEQVCHVREPMDMIKQRILAEMRSEEKSAHLLWPRLVYWLMMGGAPAAFFERQHQVLALSQEQVEACLQRYFRDDSHWLQIVFTAPQKRALSWGAH